MGIFVSTVNATNSTPPPPKPFVIPDTVEHGLRIQCSCGYKFFISDDNAQWYRSKGFELPTHCPRCIERRRVRRERRFAREAAAPPAPSANAPAQPVYPAHTSQTETPPVLS